MRDLTMIPIGKKYRLVSDELNVILQELHIAKPGPRTKVVGRENWQNIRYYSNLKNALDGMVNLEINRTGLESLEVIVAKIEELRRDIMLKLNTNNARTCKEATVDNKARIP